MLICYYIALQEQYGILPHYYFQIMSQPFGGNIYFLSEWMKYCGENSRGPPLEMPLFFIHLCKFFKAAAFVTFPLVFQPEIISLSLKGMSSHLKKISLISSLYYSYSCTSLISPLGFMLLYVWLISLSLTVYLWIGHYDSPNICLNSGIVT